MQTLSALVCELLQSLPVPLEDRTADVVRIVHNNAASGEVRGARGRFGVHRTPIE